MREIVGAAKIAKGQYWSKTLTLILGCTPVSEGCAHCWSAAMASRFPWGKGFAEGGKWTGRVEPNVTALNWLTSRARSRHKNMPKLQVICIWNDLLHQQIPSDFIESSVRLMYGCPDIFLILTKRPERLAEFKEYYGFLRVSDTDKVWFGVSVESQKHVHRIDKLIKAWPGRKFVSVEPALGSEYFNESVYLKPWIDQLDWVIIGSESGPHRRPCFELGELEKMIGICGDAGVPVFVKQWNINGKLVKMPEVFGERRDEMPEVKPWNIIQKKK